MSRVKYPRVAFGCQNTEKGYSMAAECIYRLSFNRIVLISIVVKTNISSVDKQAHTHYSIVQPSCGGYSFVPCKTLTEASVLGFIKVLR